MEFILGKARLTYRPERGYRHPRTGVWVRTPLECLRGWRAEDIEERRHWAELPNYIEEFWRHQPPATPDHDIEVDFTKKTDE